MFRLAAAGLAGIALGAAATAGAVSEFRVVSMHTGDIATVAKTHVFCHVRPESPIDPYTGPALECGETKEGISGSFGIGITDDAVYLGRWDQEGKRVTHVVYIRHHHS